MRLEQGSVASFFGPSEAHEAILAERRKWLRATPLECLILWVEGEPMLDELAGLAQAGGIRSSPMLSPLVHSGSKQAKLLRLGESWEPDFVLLLPGTDGIFKVVGGCVCFPSSWRLAEKLGQGLEFVHAPVPGLTAALGSQIDSFLTRMKPGVAWLRSNWGLSRSPELNQHPMRKLPQLDAGTPPEQIYLRVEDQALVKLPVTGGVLFGIRIVSLPLPEARTNPLIARGLVRALKTMPELMAAYKKILPVREAVVRFLES